MSTTETETKTTLQPGTGPQRHKRSGGQRGGGRQHGPSGVSRFSLRNWRVPARLTALILVPTVVGVLLAGLRVVSSIDSVGAYQRNAAAATIAGHLRDLSVQLGLERDRTVWYQTTRQQKNAVADARRAVDAGITRVRGDLTTIDADYGVRAVEDARQAGNRLDTMAVIRKGGQAAKYTDVVISLLRLHDEISQASEDTQLVGDMRGLSAMAHAKEEASEQRGILIGTLARGQRFTPDTLEDFIASRSRQKAAINTFNGEAGADNGRFLAQTVQGTQVIRAELTKSWAIALAGRNQPLRDNDSRGGAVKQWFDDSTKTIQLLQQVEARVAASVTARGSALESAERRNAIIAGILILALILLVLATTVLIARSLVRPLRRLRAEALEIAGFRLPAVVRRMRESGEAAEAPEVQPIVVGTHDEIGEVATAFDEVHRQALRLAAEESQLRGNVSAMFVNLSRRIQTLVERQISLIDGLERGEQDGGRLGDLFKLDHLATRMRRNSENLLVLAGHEAARKRSQPAKLVDVVRAALSEVEDYERVTVKVHRGSAVAGHAANDVVHLVAELVENALAFSPGTTRVVVSSSMIEGGGALLAISDSGIGMGPEEISEVNRRLADPPVVDVSASRRMGLFVVGRLALRHNIRVQLRRGDTAGLIAMVLFPPQLITVAAGRTPLMPQGDTALSPVFGGRGPASNGSAAEGPGRNGTGPQPVLSGPGSLPGRNGGGSAPLFDTMGPPAEPRGAFRDPTPTGPFAGHTGPLPLPVRPEPARSPSAGPRGVNGPAAGRPSGPNGPAGPYTGPDEGGPYPGPNDRPAADQPFPGPNGPYTGPGGPYTGPDEPRPGPGRAFAGPNGPYTGPEGPASGPFTGPDGPFTGPPARAAGPQAPGGPATGPVRRPAERPEPQAPARPVDPGAGEWARQEPVRQEPVTGEWARPEAARQEAGPSEFPLERGDEFLPIFASVESAWFRRPDAPDAATLQGPPTPNARVPSAESGPSRPADGPSRPADGPSRPVDGPSRSVDGPSRAAEPAEPSGGGTWGTMADRGRLAADAVKDPSLGGITAAGLPKRTPKANLVPGSVAGPPAAASAPVPRPDVSADLVRARMSRFQQGIQRGRADISGAAQRDSDTDSPNIDGRRTDEEGS
ncbi:sensor histidine kinase [Sphaerisporangium corydalis]|uniref:histidine kinase n=1 Tax=Sphaerisporangium corydalis TaxID=1441875 RepID=A0ABV9EUQ6_9ACTN|nr:nitrate- and nitrite sensing domain-containing protein [Sphaerisporangium corydalis]